MNIKLLLCLALAGIHLTAPARAVRSWSDAELEKASDSIIIATPMATTDLDETNSLGWPSTATFHPRFRGVETTFKVLGAFKGMPANDRIVLHHYREVPGWGIPPNGPAFIHFPSVTTNRWLLYLVKDGADRYTPVTGQIDPWLSVKFFKSATNLPVKFLFAFPYYPPIAGADPSIRHAVPIRVPTRLEIRRTEDTLSVGADTNTYETVTVTVGTNMVTGFQTALEIYPAGKPPPTKSAGVAMGGGTETMVSGSWHTQTDGIPVPGKEYEVEADIIIFETDIPPQHMWNPIGKNYRVIWQRTLKETVK